MNRLWLVLLAVLPVLVLTGCSTTITKSQVDLDTWILGRIQLAPGATIANATNVTFSVDGQTVAMESIGAQNWVDFAKVDDSQPASFTVISKNPWFSVSTHLQLARATDDSEECPSWGQKVFGNYCQTVATSVP